MRQIVFIHGGDSYKSHADYLKNLESKELDYARLLPRQRWTSRLISEFEGSDILMPSMPNSSNAQFKEWSIWFSKIVPYFGDDVRLVGHSLGAMFLAKYLHQNPLKKPVKQLHLVAGGYNLETEEYGSFKIDSAVDLDHSASEIYIYHSQDDPVVPFKELAKFQADLPIASVVTFKDRGHFLDADFPELFTNLRKN